MKRLILFFLAFFFLLAPKTLAQDEFITKVNVTYDINERGVATISHNIELKNAFSNLYATSYSLSLEGLNPANIKAYQGEKPLSVSTEKSGSQTKIKVDFDDPVVGKGKTRNFSLSFEESSLASKTGEVWEIFIPRLTSADSFDSYQASLLVPESFGQLAYVSPDPQAVSSFSGKKSYSFSKDTLSQFGVTAVFGQFQVFSFNLTYHLENPLNKTALVEIVIPPDTAFQKVNYQSLEPLPEDVRLDPDANWLATYRLEARERLDVKAAGAVQIFAAPREMPRPDQSVLIHSIADSQYWPVNDPQIKQLAKTLKTPQAIYDYVKNQLSYDDSRARPNVERLGAVKALAAPNSAICMEFTDLFVALARSAGIPARAVDGFAYTENPKIQPLSLVADVLHTWPEYWNEEKDSWIPVDPTWGKTTGGLDYFSKLDLRHFAFVSHGLDPAKPYPPGSYKLGANPQKDVFVNFGQLPVNRRSTPKISLSTLPQLPFSNINATATISNEGPVALYNLQALVLFDDEIKVTQNISVLPPFAKEEIPISIPFSLLGTKTPANIRVIVPGQEATVSTGKNWVIITSLATILFAVLLAIGVILIRLNRIKIYEKIKILKKSPQKSA